VAKKQRGEEGEGIYISQYDDDADDELITNQQLAPPPPPTERERARPSFSSLGVSRLHHCIIAFVSRLSK